MTSPSTGIFLPGRPITVSPTCTSPKRFALQAIAFHPGHLSSQGRELLHRSLRAVGVRQAEPPLIFPLT